jgi:hypothetical protein
MARSSERPPIYDDRAEAAVIGSIIQEPSYFDKIDLDPEDFYVKEYSNIFGAIIALKQRGEEITRATVIKEVSGSVGSWVIDKVVAESLPIDCLKDAATIKELSRQRHLVASLEQALRDYRKDHLPSHELADRLRLALDEIKLPSKTSRAIVVTNPRIVQAHPPTYKLTVSTINSKISGEIKISSADLDKPATFRRHVREALEINPLLPKDYTAFVHNILQAAQFEGEQEDASYDESVCYWIREWFSTTSEAEKVDDLKHGYIRRENARWFSAERLLRFLSERGDIKLDRSGLWSVIHDRGGRKGKVFRLGDKTIRLWGLDERFFTETATAEGDQMELDDLKWLEE